MENSVKSENRSFKKSLKISIRFALIYTILSLIWIWFFGSKPEFLIEIKWVEGITKEIILPWNSWINIIPNFFGVLLFGVSLLGTLNHLSSEIKKIKGFEEINKEDKDQLISVLICEVVIVVVLGLIFGSSELTEISVGFLVIVLIFGLVLALVLALAFGLPHGLHYGLTVGLTGVLAYTLTAVFGFGLKTGLTLGLTMVLAAALIILLKILFSQKFWEGILTGFVLLFTLIFKILKL